MLISLLYIIAAVFLGTRLRALGNIMHECSHGIFIKSKKLNLFFGHLMAILLFDCFDKYKKDHFAHHAYLGDSRKDPDCKHYHKIRIHYFSNDTSNILLSIISPYNWYLGLRSTFIFGSCYTTIFIFKLVYLILLIVLAIFKFKLVFYFYFVPYLTTYQLFKIFSDIVDHDYLYSAPQLKDRSRNHIFKSSFLNWLIFPRNDCYHLVHHLYPKLQISQYPIYHKRLMEKNVSYLQKNHSCDLQNFSSSGIQD